MICGSIRGSRECKKKSARRRAGRSIGNTASARLLLLAFRFTAFAGACPSSASPPPSFALAVNSAATAVRTFVHASTRCRFAVAEAMRRYRLAVVDSTLNRAGRSRRSVSTSRSHPTAARALPSPFCTMQIRDFGARRTIDHFVAPCADASRRNGSVLSSRLSTMSTRWPRSIGEDTFFNTSASVRCLTVVSKLALLELLCGAAPAPSPTAPDRALERSAK